MLSVYCWLCRSAWLILLQKKHFFRQLLCHSTLSCVMYVLVNQDIIGSHNGLWPVEPQAIITLRPRQMDAISQTTFSNAFSWMKIFEYRLKFHWSLFIRVELTKSQHWFRYWLGADQATSHYLDQWWLDYRRIYTSLGLNELSELSSVDLLSIRPWKAYFNEIVRFLSSYSTKWI